MWANSPFDFPRNCLSYVPRFLSLDSARRPSAAVKCRRTQNVKKKKTPTTMAVINDAAINCYYHITYGIMAM